MTGDVFFGHEKLNGTKRYNCFVSITHFTVRKELAIRNKQVLQLVACSGTICVSAVSCDQCGGLH